MQEEKSLRTPNYKNKLITFKRNKIANTNATNIRARLRSHCLCRFVLLPFFCRSFRLFSYLRWIYILFFSIFVWLRWIGLNVYDVLITVAVGLTRTRAYLHINNGRIIYSLLSRALRSRQLFIALILRKRENCSSTSRTIQLTQSSFCMERTKKKLFKWTVNEHTDTLTRRG